jgi:adenine-specific DNA-methyltransferase
LGNVISRKHDVVVGDANGADKAVQKYFHDAAYEKVTVFSSGMPRNNLGAWKTREVTPPKSVKGFQFYAAKDREMAREADVGLMIWDGKSSGTVLNVLRLMRAGKNAVLFSVPEERAINIKGPNDWEDFLRQCSSDLVHDVRERATPDEWQVNPQPSFLDAAMQSSMVRPTSALLGQGALTASLNEALAAADPAAVVDVLGNIAKTHGMTHVAKETGLARESLYRALGAEGNPEFATVLKVMSCLGLRLTVSTSRPVEHAAE